MDIFLDKNQRRSVQINPDQSLWTWAKAAGRAGVLFLMVTAMALMVADKSGAITYSPAAGLGGSAAISMDDPAFVAWAAAYENYMPGSEVDAVWQTPEYSLGPAAGTSYDVVSLGRGGSITLCFDTPLQNGEGWDFAVFENSFNNYNLELAFVEVSSNGVEFVRFDAISRTPSPVSTYGSVDATRITGFAGKYKQGYGVPFDLSDLAEKSLVQSGQVDLSAVSHIRIVDVIGDGSTMDADGNPVYDPYPTFGSAGFDLDAVGVSNGAPYPEDSIMEAPDAEAPEKDGSAGFGGDGGCFIDNLF